MSARAATVQGVIEALEWEDAPAGACLRLPDREVRAAIVALHPASDGSARQPLFEHLAGILAPQGVAVLSYDRRPPASGRGDAGLEAQAADAVSGMRALRDRLGCPVGVFGFSQGAWAATLAAGEGTADLLVVLGCSGVSPAAQMRYLTDELLRRSGYDEATRATARRLRERFEAFLRRDDRSPQERSELDARLRRAAREPWFPLAGLPAEAPGLRAQWADMDFDPVPSFARVRVPVLAVWGADEECVPRPRSRDAWARSGADVTLVDLAGCGHWPVVGSGEPGFAYTDQAPVPEFAAALTAWLRLIAGDQPS